MSEELKKGIPKAIPTGETIKFTPEEKEKYDSDLEGILKRIGVLKEKESIGKFKHPK